MELTLPRAINNYMTAITLEGKSPKTILWYRRKLTRFATFMQDGGTSAKVRSLTLDDERSFIKSLSGGQRYPCYRLLSSRRVAC
jgi:site-specific recombinase XerD